MDELLLSKSRLGIVAELLANEWVAFSGAHVAKLVDAEYIEELKSFVNRRPLTRYRLTDRGRSAFRNHVSQLQSLLKAE